MYLQELFGVCDGGKVSNGIENQNIMCHWILFSTYHILHSTEYSL